MVRPPERFRHGARRISGGIEPIIVARDFVYPEKRAIYSGSQGFIASFNLYDQPRALVSTASRGVLDTLTAFFNASPPSGEYEIIDTSEQMAEANALSVEVSHVIDGYYYCAALRLHAVSWYASIQYQLLNLQGEPVGGVLNARALWDTYEQVIDLVLYSVNLETGEVASSSEVVYEYLLSGPTEFATITIPSDYETSSSHTIYPFAVAMNQLLPSHHPFKSCGASVWSDTDDIAEPITGTPDDPISMTSYISNHIPIFVRASRLGGLNTETSTRALRATGSPFIDSYSQYQLQPGSLCAAYRTIGALWADTFSQYSSANLTPRDEVFTDLSGLNSLNQQEFLSVRSTPPPATISDSSARPSLFATVDPVYFQSSDGELLFTEDDGYEGIEIHCWFQ